MGEVRRGAGSLAGTAPAASFHPHPDLPPRRGRVGQSRWGRCSPPSRPFPSTGKELRVKGGEPLPQSLPLAGNPIPVPPPWQGTQSRFLPPGRGEVRRGVEARRQPPCQRLDFTPIPAFPLEGEGGGSWLSRSTWRIWPHAHLAPMHTWLPRSSVGACADAPRPARSPLGDAPLERLK